MSFGYHAGLLSLAAFREATAAEMLAHCARIAEEIPLVGFYLQPAVGGVVLDAAFWEAFCRLDNVIAVKVAPFNRYRTLDVVRGLVQAGAEERIALYTGNDDHIVFDLAAGFSVMRDGAPVVVQFRGGLLGHWSVWTRSACQMLRRIHAAVAGSGVTADILALDSACPRLQRGVLRRGHRFPRLHRRLPRGAATPGAAGRHLVPRPGRRVEPRPTRGDRPGLPRPCGPVRRRLRRGQSGALACGVTALS